MPEMKTESCNPAKPEYQRGLTLRSFFVCVFALLLMGAWIEYQECYLTGGPLAENAPPNSAIAVIFIVLAISGALYLLRRPFKLIKAELIFIYAALLVAAPLMTQGMWHRFFTMTTAIPHNRDFKSYESLPPMLWPHGDNLVFNGRFVEGLNGYMTAPGGKYDSIDIEWKGKKWKSPLLSNVKGTAGNAEISFNIPCKKDNKQILIPGESFLFSSLVKVDGFTAESSYYINMRIDEGVWNTIYNGATNTAPSFSNRGGFDRIGVTPVIIPEQDTKPGAKPMQNLTIAIGIKGPGSIAVQDVEFFNNMAVEGLYAGRRIVQAKNNKALGDNERAFLLEKPDNMFSFAGLKYLLTAYIPWNQWVVPLIAWTVLIGALFMGFMGFNVLMRKHWIENERYTLPMNIFPRQFFGEEVNTPGEAAQSLFSNKIMWIGFAITFVIVIFKGLSFYFPAIPPPPFTTMWGGQSLATYVDNPNLKALLGNMTPVIIFSLLAITLLIETELLFSIWCGFFLFQFMFMFGKMYKWNRFSGYPWEWQQAIGSFIAYALIGVYAARKHLTKVIDAVFKRKSIDDSSEILSYRAALVFIIISILVLVLWGCWTKMGAGVSLLFFGWLLVCGFSASKIRAEVGMPFAYWTPYFGMIFVSAIGGFAIFGTTGMLVATMASGFMCTSCFLFIAPVQVEMMELGRHFKVRPKDIRTGLIMGLIGGIFIGGFTLLSWAYGIGGDNMKYAWPYSQNWYFNGYRQGELSADRSYTAAVSTGKAYTPAPDNAPLNIFKSPLNIDAKGLVIGIAVTLILALCRGLFIWFPLHPIGYVLATTFFGRTMWFSILIAWLVRVIVLKIGGVHSIRKGLTPFAVGMFLACISSIIVFEVVGFVLRAQGITSVYALWP
ncbi:MAG: DUF6785 family protein [bacterium]